MVCISTARLHKMGGGNFIGRGSGDKLESVLTVGWWRGVIYWE